MLIVRLKQGTSGSQVEHSTTEPLYFSCLLWRVRDVFGTNTIVDLHIYYICVSILCFIVHGDEFLYMGESFQDYS